MLSDIYLKDIEGLYKTPIVQQTAFWSAVKQKLGSQTLAVNYNFETNTNSDILVIVKPVSRNHCIAYVPYGPELEPDEDIQTIFLEELSECLRSFLPASCIMIRYDLCWESWWSKEAAHFDEKGHWLGEPGIDARELRFNISTINQNFHKAHHNILPSNTIYLDLRPSTDEILHRMRPKTRYNIGLAQRKGVQVRIAGIEQINTWYSLYTETAHRNNIYLNDLKYFEAVLLAKSHSTQSPADVRLLIAEAEGKALAAMFLIITGNRGSYLYGASSSLHRSYMATYALQWEAMCISKQLGCIEYDMFGVSPTADPSHPLYGLYKFKSGFGGNIYHSLGAWDYPLLEVDYQTYRYLEMTNRGFHLNS